MKYLIMLFLTGFIFAQPGKSAMTQAQADTMISRLGSLITLSTEISAKIDTSGDGGNDSLLIVNKLIKLNTDELATDLESLLGYTLLLLNYQDTIIARLNSNLTDNDTSISRLDEIIANTASLSNDSLETLSLQTYNKIDTLLIIAKPTDTFNGGTKNIDTVATRLTALSSPCKYLYIMNNTPNTYIWFLPNSGLTTANGYGNMGYLDEARIEIENANKLYIIASAPLTAIRYYYGN